jgi:hypothetical protein
VLPYAVADALFIQDEDGWQANALTVVAARLETDVLAFKAKLNTAQISFSDTQRGTLLA